MLRYKPGYNAGELPDGRWSFKYLWAKASDPSADPYDYNKMTVSGPDGQVWTQADWVPNATGGRTLTSFAWWPAVPKYLFWYEAGQGSSCGDTRQSRLLRMDLVSGQVQNLLPLDALWASQIDDTTAPLFLYASGKQIRVLNMETDQITASYDYPGKDAPGWGVQQLLYVPDFRKIMVLLTNPWPNCGQPANERAVAVIDMDSGTAVQQPIPAELVPNGIEFGRLCNPVQ